MINNEFVLIKVDKGASSEITRDNFPVDQFGITKWLINKNIIFNNEILTGFHDIMPWKRTGGETYCSSFEFSTNKYLKQIIIKAIVTLSPEKSLVDWARRREVLMKNGISVSNWYHFGDAIIIEDFYPKTAQHVSFDKILTIGYKLDQLGFSTLKFIDDIRADIYNNPFYIDFGFDLGDPSDKIKTSAKDNLLLHYPDRQNEINMFYNN